LADFSAAIAQNPQFIPAYRGRSVVYMKMGDVNSAQKDLYTATQLKQQTQTNGGAQPQ
jgi:Tfp pilus assembly protein PilF